MTEVQLPSNSVIDVGANNGKYQFYINGVWDSTSTLTIYKHTQYTYNVPKDHPIAFINSSINDNSNSFYYYSDNPITDSGIKYYWGSVELTVQKNDINLDIKCKYHTGMYVSNKIKSITQTQQSSAGASGGDSSTAHTHSTYTTDTGHDGTGSYKDQQEKYKDQQKEMVQRYANKNAVDKKRQNTMKNMKVISGNVGTRASTSGSSASAPKLGSADNKIDLSGAFASENAFFIPLSFFHNLDNSLNFTADGDDFKIDLSGTYGTGNDNSDNIVNVSSFEIKDLSENGINGHYTDASMVVIKDYYHMIFDLSNGIMDGRTDKHIEQIKKVKEIQQQQPGSIDMSKYKNSQSQINKFKFSSAGGGDISFNGDLSGVRDFIQGFSGKAEKMKQMNSMISNIFSNENNKDVKSKGFDISGLDFDLDLDENSIFKDMKNLNVIQGGVGQDFSANRADFFGSNDNWTTNVPDKLGYALLGSSGEEITIKGPDVKITKTEGGFKIDGEGEFSPGDRFQKDGFSFEFKDGCVVNSVLESEKAMRAQFKLSRTDLSNVMNCMGAGNEIRNDFDIETKFGSKFKSGGQSNDVSMNKFINNMIDIIFDEPKNKDKKDFIADNKKFLNMELTDLSKAGFKAKTKSIILKDTSGETFNPSELKNKLSDDKGVYIKTKQGENVNFKFGNDTLKMEHASGNKFQFKSAGDISANKAGFEFNKFSNDKFEKHDKSEFNKNDLLEIMKNDVKYTLQVGSSYVVSIIDNSVVQKHIGTGQLYRKNYTVMNKKYRQQYSMRGLFDAVNTLKNTTDAKMDSKRNMHPTKNQSGDRLRKLKSANILKSKLSKSE